MPGCEASSVAPDGDSAMPEGCDPHIHMHPESTHEAPNGPHQAEDGHIPHIVEHALPVQRQAVRVQPKVPVPAKVRAQDVLGMLLHRHTIHSGSVAKEGAHKHSDASSAEQSETFAHDIGLASPVSHDLVSDNEVQTCPCSHPLL